MTFAELGLEPIIGEKEVVLQDSDYALYVKTYLPIDEKTKLIQFVADMSVDESTGTFSPIMVEMFFTLGVCRWYADIDFEDHYTTDAYDALETNGVFNQIMAQIPADELTFIRNLTEETIKDIARYNSSAAGIVNTMAKESTLLDSNVTEMLKDISEAKGLELLKDIKDITGPATSKTIVVKKD